MFAWRKSRGFQETVVFGCGLYFIAGGATMIARCSFWQSDLVMGESGGLRARIVKAVLGRLFDSIGMVPTGILISASGAALSSLLAYEVWQRRRPARSSGRKALR